jgi:hypothetical protein
LIAAYQGDSIPLSAPQELPGSEGEFRVLSSGVLSLPATLEGGVFSATLSTTGLLPGPYVVLLRETTSEQTTTREIARFSLLSDQDHSSHAERMLAAVEATLEGRATSDQLSVTVAGRSLAKHSIDDLLRLRRLYAQEVQASRGAAAIRVLEIVN